MRVLEQPWRLNFRGKSTQVFDLCFTKQTKGEGGWHVDDHRVHCEPLLTVSVKNLSPPQVSNGGRFVSKLESQGPYAPVSLSGAHCDISAAAIINGLALLPPPIAPPTISTHTISWINPFIFNCVKRICHIPIANETAVWNEFRIINNMALPCRRGSICERVFRANMAT